MGRRSLCLSGAGAWRPAARPHGGRLGLPTDFLIAPDGVVVASRLGVHAYDQWSLDTLLRLAAEGVSAGDGSVR